MNELLNHINQISPVTEDVSIDILKCIKTKTFVKGDLIHSIGNVCRHLFFIKSGLVKHFYYHKGSQFVFRFFEENDFFVATDSFLNNLPAEYSSVALENCEIIYFEYCDFEQLCQQHHCFETFARKFASIIAYTAISNLKGLLYLDATARYEKFLKEYGHLQQRISLGDTAAYLGISQVSLSRIRAKK